MAVDVVFRIFPSSGVPIYRQIMEQTEQMIASGALKTGGMLPSVRQLAEELEVNPMTISKAYMMMESAGVLERLRGHGMAVAERKAVALSVEEKCALMEPLIRQLSALAQRLGIPAEEVIEYVKSILKGNEP